MPHLFAPNTNLAPRRIEAQELRAIQRGRAVSGTTAACSLIIASSSRFAALLFLSFACTRLRALTCSQRWALRFRPQPTAAGLRPPWPMHLIETGRKPIARWVCLRVLRKTAPGRAGQRRAGQGRRASADFAFAAASSWSALPCSRLRQEHTRRATGVTGMCARSEAAAAVLRCAALRCAARSARHGTARPCANAARTVSRGGCASYSMPLRVQDTPHAIDNMQRGTQRTACQWGV
jgi:hypothetical protein